MLNASMRVALRLKKRDSVSDKLKDHGWLPIKNRIGFRTISLIITVLRHSSPSYLNECLHINLSSRDLRSQSSNLLSRNRTVVADRGFSNYAPKLWNSLSPEIREASTLPKTFNLLSSFMAIPEYKCPWP